MFLTLFKKQLFILSAHITMYGFLKGHLLFPLNHIYGSLLINKKGQKMTENNRHLKFSPFFRVECVIFWYFEPTRADVTIFRGTNAT